MPTRRRRMLEDLPRRGVAPKPQPCELDAVRRLAHHDRRPPDQGRDEAWRHECLFVRHEQQVAERPFRLHLDGMRCLDERTLQRPGPVCERVRPRSLQHLPVVVRRRAGRCRLALVVNPTARLCLRAGTELQVAAIDAQRLRVRVRQGKGGKDRCVPLAPRVLEWWRAYWPRARPWLGPA
jgi:integrase/recombinase XerD